MATTARPVAPLSPPAAAAVPAVIDASGAQLARLREFLGRVDFTFGELFTRGERAKAEGRDDAQLAGELPLDADRIDDAVSVLRALFIAGKPLPVEVVHARLAPADAALLEELQLLRPHDRQEGHVLATVLICPIAGLWLFCDHPYVPEGEKWPTDAVFSPLTTNTQHFMLTMSRRPCDELLELCSGSGVAALAAARLARHTVGVDITARSTRFAAASARLNGIENAEMLEGDLFAAVTGRTFDRIVAHPPYMPAFEQEYVFRDGGADGEQITRRVIAGIPDHLRPGGRAFVLCLATDRKDAPLQERVRGWLGERQGEFDLLLVEMDAPHDPTEYYAHRAYDQGGGFAEVEPRHRYFREAGVTAIVYVAILIQRRASERKVFTSRRKKGMLTAAPHLDWALAWETALLGDALLPALLELAPRPSPDMRMAVTYRPGTDGFEMEGCRLVVETPMAYEVSVPPWVSRFVESALEGRTLRELLAALQSEGVLPPSVTLAQFGAAVRDLATTGVVLFPGLEPPPADGQLGRVLASWRPDGETALDRIAAQTG